MIVPTFPTLLPNTSRQIGCNEGPLFRSVLFDQLHHLFILFCRPGTLDERWLEHLLPSMKTLHFRAIGKSLGNEFPILGAIFFDCGTESIVLRAYKCQCERVVLTMDKKQSPHTHTPQVLLTSSLVHLTPDDFLT